MKLRESSKTTDCGTCYFNLDTLNSKYEFRLSLYAIMDRLIHTAHKLDLKGPSMREYLAKL